MKKVLMLMLISIVSASIYGQKEKKNYLGSHVLCGTLNHNMPPAVISAVKNYLGIELDYTRQLSEKVELCFGLFATINNMKRISYWGQGTQSEDLFIIFSMSYHLKYHFLKYLFVDGGPCFNVHPSMSYKWGIGLGAGIGAEYVFESGLTFSISPYVQWNYLDVNEIKKSFSVGFDRLSQLGVKIGIGCRF